MPRSSHGARILLRALAPSLLALLAVAFISRPANAQLVLQTDIPGPSGSGEFGKNVTVLPNGNFVVADPLYDGAAVDVGSVALYDGATLALISQFTGSTINDKVGSGGVTVLWNGNFVVESPLWNGAAADTGAVTFVNGSTGLNGLVSASNSLVGSKASDRVGNGGVFALTNGNYVVVSSGWDGSATDLGAVTWADGTTGATGVVSSANSLVGSAAGDFVGSRGVVELANSNYVVISPVWGNAGVDDAGAVTWGSGTEGVSGAVAQTNSLVGSSAFDQIGSEGVTPLYNGNYVVVSTFWDGAAAEVGAVTWGDGSAGTAGAVSIANSLVGSTLDDRIGNAGAVFGGYGVLALFNGNYVVASPHWDNGGVVNAGAVTWGNGMGGTSGVVSAANSLVGSSDSDSVGAQEITALPNGNYVVPNPYWDNSAETDAGAATWGSGTGGVSGAITNVNSLVGTTANSSVGSNYVTMVGESNYVVLSPLWINGSAEQVGAVTWGDGATGISGAVSASNSLVGSTVGDRIGDDGAGGGAVVALLYGNYVVLSPLWDNGGAADAGAATWGDGASGITGEPSAANSLVGSAANDGMGIAATALFNGNYVVTMPAWNNNSGAATWGDGAVGVRGVVSTINSLYGGVGDRVGSFVANLFNGNYVVSSVDWDGGGIPLNGKGAATWGNGDTGSAGKVTTVNSLVGSSQGDRVGTQIVPLANGNYVVGSIFWDNAAASSAGAATWGNGTSGSTGVVSVSNSIVGVSADDHFGLAVPLSSPDGNYIAAGAAFNGPANDSGAAALVSGRGPMAGPVSSSNSALGTAAGGGFTMDAEYIYAQQKLVVGRPADNMVTILAIGWPLEVVKHGTGTGSVISIPPAIACGITCSAEMSEIQENHVITLTAVADVSSTFTGWSGDCSGTLVCTVAMTQTRNVTATFVLKSFDLTLSTTGSGSGAITGAPANPIDYGTVVTLTAVPATLSAFDRWGGDASGAQNPLVVTVTGDLTISADFPVADVYLPAVRNR